MYRVHGEDSDSCACLNMNYRSRAITGHSQLVVPPPLSFQAKKRFFICFLYDNLMAKNMTFELKPQPVVARLRYLLTVLG